MNLTVNQIRIANDERLTQQSHADIHTMLP